MQIKAAVTALAASILFAAACDAATSGGGGETKQVQAATLDECDGADVALLDIVAANEVTYITFGAKWCESCKLEVPVINDEVVEHFEGESVGAVQILIENDPGDPPTLDLCTEWRVTLGARFRVLVDTEQVTIDQYFDGAVATLPLHMIVTKDGTIRFRKLGEIPDNLQQLIADWLPQ